MVQAVRNWKAVFGLVTMIVVVTILVLALVLQAGRDVVQHGSVRFEFSIRSNPDMFEPSEYWCRVTDQSTGYDMTLWLGSYHGTKYSFNVSRHEILDLLLVGVDGRPGRIVLIFDPRVGIMWPTDDPELAATAREKARFISAEKADSPLVLTDINSNK